jgi:hypothetical protein
MIKEPQWVEKAEASIPGAKAVLMRMLLNNPAILGISWDVGLPFWSQFSEADRTASLNVLADHRTAQDKKEKIDTKSYLFEVMKQLDNFDQDQKASFSLFTNKDNEHFAN